MKEILMELLSNLILVIVPAISGLIIYGINKFKKYIDDKQKSETIDKILNTTVKYVEQVFVDIKGKEKLLKATEIAKRRLDKIGIELDEVELIILLESFVNGLKN